MIIYLVSERSRGIPENEGGQKIIATALKLKSGKVVTLKDISNVQTSIRDKNEALTRMT